MSLRPVIDADVCVVGAGVVGMAHAHAAVARGLRVVVLERNHRAVGASVRNFGHGFVSAMGAGEAFELALRSRELWLELGPRAGLEVLDAGSLLVAHHADELAVIERLALDERRGIKRVRPSDIPALAPIPTDGVLGAMHATLDIRVDPRRAVACLAALLDEHRDGRIIWSSPVHGIEPGRVESARATVRAPWVIACPGPSFEALPPAVRPRREGLTRCKLQMLRVAAPDGRQYPPALLTGLSLLRYPAFTALAESLAVGARWGDERPELLAAGIHLIVTQLPDGDLILGDTHEYGDTVAPFRDERLDELVLGETRRLLGVDRLEVRERWQGVYPVAPGDPFLVTNPLPGVLAVEVVAGVGMTTALGLAERVIEGWAGAVTEPKPKNDQVQLPAARRPSEGARAGYGS
jgi:D-hydroxyproline dehydrogenase subunit beta